MIELNLTFISTIAVSLAISAFLIQQVVLFIKCGLLATQTPATSNMTDSQLVLVGKFNQSDQARIPAFMYDFDSRWKYPLHEPKSDSFENCLVVVSFDSPVLVPRDKTRYFVGYCVSRDCPDIEYMLKDGYQAIEMTASIIQVECPYQGKYSIMIQIAKGLPVLFEQFYRMCSEVVEDYSFIVAEYQQFNQNKVNLSLMFDQKEKLQELKNQLDFNYKI